jgi:hypothetical protein
MEQQLQAIPFVVEPLSIVLAESRSRTTRGVKIGSKYKDLMSKSRREEVEKEILQDDDEPEVIESDV